MPESRVDDDARLVKRAKKGDSEAFGQLHDRYADSIFRFLQARLDNRMDAEDLFGEVFLRAWHSLPRYQQQGYPFSAYLFRIARNLLVDHYRKSSRHEEVLQHNDSLLQAVQSSPDEKIMRKQEYQELNKKLAGMREDYRDVLVLRFISGLSPDETAAVMGRSSGAIRVLQHRALKAFREQAEVGKE
jgi:RNA polymerase sigma-70 factor, ECF subfamily